MNFFLCRGVASRTLERKFKGDSFSQGLSADLLDTVSARCRLVAPWAMSLQGMSSSEIKRALMSHFCLMRGEGSL